MTAENVLPGVSLLDAREWLRERLEDGDHCPCCGQMAKVYRRKIHAGMARDLITAYRRSDHGIEWFHIRTVLGHDGGDFAKLAHWGLVIPQPGERGDGSTRTGWWRLTYLGRQFVCGYVNVDKFALLYNGRCVGMEGPGVTIRDALGTRFNYTDLLAGV